MPGFFALSTFSAVSRPTARAIAVPPKSPLELMILN